MAHVGQRGVAAKKPHHHVGVFSLRLDIGFDIGTPSLEFGEHLLPGVSAFYDVALNFPLNAQLFFRVEPDLEVESVANCRNQKRMQALHKNDVTWVDDFGPFDCAVAMVVDRLSDRLSALKRENLLLHQSKVVRPWIKCGKPHQAALMSVERMVVVQANAGDALGSEHLVEGRSKRAFAAAAVAADTDKDGTLRSFRFGLCLFSRNRLCAFDLFADLAQELFKGLDEELHALGFELARYLFEVDAGRGQSRKFALRLAQALDKGCAANHTMVDQCADRSQRHGGDGVRANEFFDISCVAIGWVFDAG